MMEDVLWLTEMLDGWNLIGCGDGSNCPKNKPQDTPYFHKCKSYAQKKSRDISRD